MTNEELIKEVKKLAEKLRRTPKKREFEHHNKASKVFGTWNNFIIAAGLKPLRKTGLTKEECAEYIHDFVQKHNRTPTQKDFDNDLYLPDSTTIMRIFQATWLEVLEELGYVPDKYFHLTDDNIYEIIRDEIERIGSTKKSDFNNFKRDSTPSYTYIQKRLGKKWNEILNELGYELNLDKRTKDEWLKILWNLSVELERTPTISDLNNHGIEDNVFNYHFGTYNNALKVLGLEPNLEKPTVTHSDEELVDMYKKLSEKLGHPATMNNINDYLPYSYDVYAIRFGGINGVRKLAGYDTVDSYRKYTKKEIKNILINTYKEHGRRLTNKELNQLSKENESFPSLSSILRYFSTTKMTEVWEEIEKELRL